MRAVVERSSCGSERCRVWADMSGVVQYELPEHRTPANSNNSVFLDVRKFFNPKSKAPQVVKCGWTGDYLLFRYTGACKVCGRLTFDEASGRNDPRGILGDNSGMVFDSSDDATLHPGASVVVCFLCGNEESSYQIAMEKLSELSRKLHHEERGLS